MDDQQEEKRRKYKIFHVDFEIFKNPGISQKIDPNPKKSRDPGILRYGIFRIKIRKSRDLGSPKNPIPLPPLVKIIYYL